METKQSRTIHVEHGYQKNAYTYYPVLIVGAGETGIAMGCQLKAKYGFDQFRIFDRQSGIGGTWWINRYPGVACDVPCALYSYSFEPYYDADRNYPSGQNIVHYLHRVASKFEIVDKIQLNTDISELRWMEADQEWEVTITYMAPGTGDMGAKDRERYVAKHGRESVYLKQEKARVKIAISAIGGLVEPKEFPLNVPGSESFKGEIFHTARWKDDVNLKDKDVVVVGTGCSSVQVVGALLEEHGVKSITQLMTSPPWVDPKVPEPDRSVWYPKSVQELLIKYRATKPLLRKILCVGAEEQWFHLFLNNDSNKKRQASYKQGLLKGMKSKAPVKYHEMLTPDYPPGCKRRIFDQSPGWYDGMHDARYRLTTQKLLNVQPEGVTLSGNQSYPRNTKQDPNAQDEHVKADVLILANGYDIRDWLHPLKVIGKGGKSIHDVWKERGGPQAYMCCAMDGYPNLFILNGPNVYTGHHSVFLASENMVMYTLNLISDILSGTVKTVEVKKSAELAWTARIQRELKNTVFADRACNSWYKTENDWNSTTYPRSQTDFMMRCYFPTWSDWNVVLTETGERKMRLRQMLKWTAAIVVLVGTYWARKYGRSMVDVLKGSLKDRLNWALQIGTIVLMQLQRRLQ